MIIHKKIFNPLLYFISKVFKKLVLFRIFLYKKGWLRTTFIETPIISVGNLTVGGTGKTPIVDYLTKEFKNNNLNPAILSKGYGRKKYYSEKRLKYCEDKNIDPSFFGDEPYLLAMRNPEVPVFVSNSRIKISILAEKKDQPNIIILDDAFQYLKLHRDLNLLLIDSENGFGNGHLLPLGILREPKNQCARADAIIVTKSNLYPSKKILTILKNDLKVTCPIFNFDYKVNRLYSLDGKSQLEKNKIRNKKILAVSGIAQPISFARSIEDCGAKIISKIDFPDHYKFEERDIKKILNEIQKTQPDLIITTEKDAVKLRTFSKILNNTWILEMKIEVEKSWNNFFEKFLDSFFDQQKT